MLSKQSCFAGREKQLKGRSTYPKICISFSFLIEETEPAFIYVYAHMHEAHFHKPRWLKITEPKSQSKFENRICPSSKQTHLDKRDGSLRKPRRDHALALSPHLGLRAGDLD